MEWDFGQFHGQSYCFLFPLSPPQGHICVQCGGEIFVGLAAPGTANFDFVYLQPGTWGRFAGQPLVLSVERSGLWRFIWLDISPCLPPSSTINTLRQMGITAIRLGGSFTIGDYYAWYNW